MSVGQKRQRRSFSLDGRILSAIENQAQTIRDVCEHLFPELTWEQASTKVRTWPQFQGALATTAWIIHWRCRMMARRGLIQMMDRIHTDRFGPRPPVPPEGKGVGHV